MHASRIFCRIISTTAALFLIATWAYPQVLVESTKPSLQDLKRIGANRSNYGQRSSAQKQKAPEADLKVFQDEILPILEYACFDCHGPSEQEANIRVDKLDPDLLQGQDVDWWLEVFSVISKGEMPPPEEITLASRDRAKLIEWLSTEIQNASNARRNERRLTSFRRMTRYEYSYALQDLLNLPFDFAADLPPDPHSEEGFANSSEMLHLSTIQLGIYRDSARKALQRAIVFGEKPEPIFWGVSMTQASGRERKKQDEERRKILEKHKDAPDKLEQALARHSEKLRRVPSDTHYKELGSAWTARASWSYGGAKYAWSPSESKPEAPEQIQHVAILPPGKRLIVELGDRIPDRGPMRVRVRAARATADERAPSLQLEFGWQASNDSDASVRVSQYDQLIEADSTVPKFYQWDISLGEVYPRNSVRNINKMGDLPSPSEFLKFVNSSDQEGSVQIDYVEVSAPAYQQWPPESHQRLFPASEHQGRNETEYARELLVRFLPRAWRRPVTALEIETKLQLFSAVRATSNNFPSAMLEVYANVLASPNFLYLGRTRNEMEDSNRLLEFDLATRLTMFLWSSAPDQELFDLAQSGKLAETQVYESQVDRLLADHRSERFVKHFVRQWLDLQLLDYLDVDRERYPHFDVSLKEAMQQEPVAFFQELLRGNESVLELLHSGFTMANERLARHYGLPDVYGNHLRRVALGPEHSRGGLLTQPGLLAMNSDGKDSHPLKRGIWLLESLLNDPPPPPPPAVPEIDLADPEIAKLTLKERIEDHRNDPACLSCHQKIDPWGIAFEDFDAVGSFRREIEGRPVESTSQLFNGQVLAGMDGLKRYLLEHRQDQFVRAMVYKISTYALGRPLNFGDRSAIDDITSRVRQKGDGLATLFV